MKAFLHQHRQQVRKVTADPRPDRFTRTPRESRPKGFRGPASAPGVRSRGVARSLPDGLRRVRPPSKDAPCNPWHTPDARDFRMETLGPQYKSSVLSEEGKGVYVAKVAKPEKGWTAFFVELTFPSGCQAPFKFTTDVRVILDTLNYKFTPKGRPL